MIFAPSEFHVGSEAKLFPPFYARQVGQDLLPLRALLISIVLELVAFLMQFMQRAQKELIKRKSPSAHYNQGAKRDSHCSFAGSHLNLSYRDPMFRCGGP